MSEFIVDTTTISRQGVREELEALIAAQPSETRLTQFFASSTGQIALELLSGYFALLKFDSISSRRENFLQHAQTRGGVIAGAQNQGYSAFRGRNALLTITIIPSGSGVYPQFYQLGDVAGYGLILLEETTYSEGTPVTLNCVVGDIDSETLSARNESINKFRFTKKRVSADLRIFIDNTQVEFSDDILDLLEGKFHLQTNPIGSVDANYLNDASSAVRYVANSEIKLEWVELRDLTFDEAQVALDEAEGSLITVVTTNLYQDPEDITSIRINAPLENETKFTIRGRNDYVKLLSLSNPNLIATGGRDTAVAAIVEIFGLKEDLSILSEQEKNDFLETVRVRPRPLGVLPPLIVDPEPYFLNIVTNLCLNSGVQGDPLLIAREIYSGYEKRLANPEEELELDFKIIEAQFNSKALIQTTRLSIETSQWEANKAYVRGSHVVSSLNNSFVYEALEYVRYTGDVEPIWPAPIELQPPLNGFLFGQEVEDNGILWEAVAKDSTAQDWVANTVYRVGDIVRSSQENSSFKVVGLFHSSSSNVVETFAFFEEQGITFTADFGGSIGNNIEVVFDGNDDLDQAISNWNINNPNNSVSHNGTGTDVLNQVTIQLEGGVDEVNSEPSWPVPSSPTEADERSFTTDNHILWLMVARAGAPTTWNPSTKYETGDTVVPLNEVGGQSHVMWQMVSFIGKSGDSEPNFPTEFGEVVIDGDITWITRNLQAANNVSSSPASIGNNEYFLITEKVTVS